MAREDLIYKNIEQHIRAKDSVFTDAGLSKIKHIEPFEDQYNPMNEDMAFERPAVFVQFLNTGWEEYSQNEQRGTMRIRIHLVQENYSKGNENSRDQNTALNRLKLPHFLNKILHGYASDYNGPLHRRNENSEPTNEALKIKLMDYDCLVKDDAASKLNKYTYTTENETELGIECDENIL